MKYGNLAHMSTVVRTYLASWLDRLGGKERVVPIATYIGASVVLGLAGWFGGPVWLFLLVPMVVGATIVLARPRLAQVCLTRFEAWVAAKDATFAGREGKLARYIVRPSIFAFREIEKRTAAIADEFNRCAVRVAGYLYLWAFLLVGAYVAIVVVVAIAVIAVALIVGLLILELVSRSGSSGNVLSRGSSALGGWASSGGGSRSRLTGTTVVKEGILFDSPAGVRIDQEGRVMKEGILFDSPAGVRVNEAGQVVQEGILFDSPSGVRVNEGGQIVKEGVVFDTPTGYRVNEKGELVKEGIVFDTPTGVKFKKE